MIILSVNIPLDSKMLLLHLYPTDLNLKPQEHEFTDFVIWQTKRIIVLNWKKTDAPTIGAWIKTMAQFMSIERITYTWGCTRKSGNLFIYFIKKGNIGKPLREEMQDRIPKNRGS